MLQTTKEGALLQFMLISNVTLFFLSFFNFSKTMTDASETITGYSPNILIFAGDEVKHLESELSLHCKHSS